MVAPFVPRSVVSRFMYDVLSHDAGVTAALGTGGVIIPDEAIPGSDGVLTLAQTFAGGVRAAKPLGQAIAQVEMYWELTGWAPTYSRETAEPVMLAAMAALIGPQTRGATHRWIDDKDGRAWAVEVDWVSEEPVPLDTTTPQVFAPIRHRYRVVLRPRGA